MATLKELITLKHQYISQQLHQSHNAQAAEELIEGFKEDIASLEGKLGEKDRLIRVYETEIGLLR